MAIINIGANANYGIDVATSDFSSETNSKK